MHYSIYCVFNIDLLLQVSGSLCKFPEQVIIPKHVAANQY